MPIRNLTPPAAEPVTLAETKLFLRVDHDDEDGLIGDMIAAARERVEALSGRAMIMRTVLETLDGLSPDDAQSLGARPVSAVSALRTLDEDGVATVAGAEIYYLDAESDPPLLVRRAGARWPEPERRRGGIQIEYAAGYGAGPEDVPDALRQAVLEIVAQTYERGGAPGPLSPSVRGLLAPFSRVRL